MAKKSYLLINLRPLLVRKSMRSEAGDATDARSMLPFLLLSRHTEGKKGEHLQSTGGRGQGPSGHLALPNFLNAKEITISGTGTPTSDLGREALSWMITQII